MVTCREPIPEVNGGDSAVLRVSRLVDTVVGMELSVSGWFGENS